MKKKQYEASKKLISYTYVLKLSYDLEKYSHCMINIVISNFFFSFSLFDFSAFLDL